MTTVDFYYGLSSRYSYLAACRIAAIEERTGARFRWCPLQSSLLIAQGGNPFAGPPLSGQYDWGWRRRDAEAWAAWIGVPFRDPVGRLTCDEQLPALAALAAGRQGAVTAMSQRLFRLIFVDDRSSLAHDDILAEAAACGLDRAHFEADLDGADLAEEHRRVVEEAARRGAFGVPSFVLEDGRMFWGNDRLVLLEAALAGRI